jgi:ATP-binding cassette, subfamily C, bacterial LapB
MDLTQATLMAKGIRMGWKFSIPSAAFLNPTLSYKPRAFEIGMASLCINILGLATSLVTLQVYDRILVYQNMGTLNLLCLGAAIALLVETALKLSRAYAMGWGAAVFEHTVSCNAVRHTLTKDSDHVRNLGIGEYLQRISAVGKIRDFYSGQSLATLIDLPFTLIFLTIIGYLGGNLVIAPLVLLTVMSIRAVALGRRLKKALKQRDSADDARYNFLIQTLNGVHTVKSMGLEAPFERRYEKTQSASSRAHFEVARLSAAAYDQGVMASHAMMIVVAVLGAPLALTGELTLGALIACVMLSGRIMQPVQRALGFWTRLQDIEIAHQKIANHFSDESDHQSFSSPIGEKEGRVELKEVSFSGAGQELFLDQITLSLKPGEAISISGEHDAGKQALMNLIAGMHKPPHGSVSINGIPPHCLTSEELVTHVGYLPPVGVIFHGTIYENLSRFGKIEEARVHEMAQLLGLDLEIASLPAGYDTKLEGGNADVISPGLRQRIAIARVLGAKPRVLLFYNADRALDKEGYNNVYRLLGRLKGRITLVLVSNDQNILRLADTHYHLEQGRLNKADSEITGVFYDVPAYQEVRR